MSDILTRQTLVQLEFDALRAAATRRQREHTPEAVLGVALLLMREVDQAYEQLLVTAIGHGCVDAETFQAHADRLARVRTALDAQGRWLRGHQVRPEGD